MAQKKKIVFDNRDALEILRVAFGGAKTPRVAELETRKKRTRVIASDPYREPIASIERDVPLKVSRQLQSERKAKGAQPTIQESGETFRPFYEEAPPPVAEQPPRQESTAQQSNEENTDKQSSAPLKPQALVREAIDIGLEEKGILNRPKSLEKVMKDIESQRAKLSPEEHEQFEDLRRRYQEQIEKGASPTKEENMPVPNDGSEVPDDIKTYAEELAAGVEKNNPIESKVEVVQKQSRKTRTDNLMRSEHKEGVIPKEKTEPMPVEPPTAPPPPVSKPEGNPAEMEQKKETLAKQLAEEFSSRTTPEGKRTAIEIRIQNLLKDQPSASEKYKEFLADVQKRALELTESETAQIEQTHPPEPPALKPLESEKFFAPEQHPTEGELGRWENEGGALPLKKTVDPAPVSPPDIGNAEEQLKANLAKVAGETDGEKKEIEFRRVLTQEEVDAMLASVPKEKPLKIPEDKNKKSEDLPKEQEKSREDHIKLFEEKKAALEAKINETGGTREEKDECRARQVAEQYGYDLAKIIGELAWLQKPENKKGNLLKIKNMETARQLVAAEIGEAPATQAIPPEAVPATEASVETAPADIDKAFEEFGISKDDFARVEGFHALNDNQKAFIFENLRRVLYGDIETRAKAMLAEETSKQSGLRRTGRKAFEGFAGQGGKLAVKEAEALKAIRTGGIAAHGETLRLLVHMVSREEVKINPDTGAPEVSYINPNEFESDEQEHVKQYNEAAQKFANIPETWSHRSASKKEYAQYKTTHEQYDNVRNQMLKLVYLKTKDFSSAYEYMQNRDAQISMQRVLTAYPQLETVLKNVSDIETRSHGKVAAWSTIKESGWKSGIVGLSSLARYKSISVLAFSATEAAVGVGAIVNSAREAYQARNKAREELETARQDLTRKETVALKLKGGRKLFGLGKKEHTRLAGHAFRKSTFIDASNYAERMDSLVLKINDPVKTGEERKLNEQHLYKLVRMAEEHIAEGLVNFGKGASRLSAAYEFTNQLAHARVELARKDFFNDKTPVSGTMSLETFMDKKMKRMSAEQRKFVLRGFMRGLAVGAVAGGVGAAFGGWVKDQFGDDIQQWIGSAREKIGVGGGKTVRAPKNLPIISEQPTPSKGIKTPASAPHSPLTPDQLEQELRNQFSLSDPGAGDSSVKMESSAEFPGGRKGPRLPATLETPEKDINISRFKTSHPIDMESSRPLSAPEDIVSSTPVKKSGLEAALESETEYTKLAKVKKGEGMWHAVRRQLNYQMSHTSPEEFAKRYGIPTEDIQLHPKKSVERITANLLADQDYIKPKGTGGAWTETRLKPGANVLLGEDGKIEITNKDKFTYEWSKPGAATATDPLAQPSGAVETATTPAEAGKAGPTLTAPEKIPPAPAISERLLSQPENTARKMSGLNLDKYADVRDTPLAKFLKKPPHGKEFRVLVDILHQAKPSKADMQQSISEFLTKRFSV